MVVVLTEDGQKEVGLVEETSFLFLNGLKRYKSKPWLVVPIPLVMLVGTAMVSSMVAGGIVNYHKTDWVQLCINFIFIPVSVACGALIIFHKNSFSNLSQDIDAWWDYNYLPDEKIAMKNNARNWMEWYGFYYYSGMYFACAMNLVPLLKRYILGRSSDPMNNLMYPCWTPLDLETWWGFILTYLFQFTSMYLSYISFGNICFYLTTAYVSLGYQAQLVSVAILTVGERARKRFEDDTDFKKNRKEYLDLLLQDEITSCIKHYQKIHRCAKEITRILSALAILAYDTGMLVVTLSGIRIATETEKLMVVNSFMNTGVTLGNQFIISFICELLTEEVDKLRNIVYRCNWINMPVICQKYVNNFQIMTNYMPTLVTLTGTKTNFENFSKVVNASYCYFSLILSMRNN